MKYSFEYKLIFVSIKVVKTAHLFSWTQSTFGGFSKENFFVAATLLWHCSHLYASSPSPNLSLLKYASNPSFILLIWRISINKSWKCWNVVETWLHSKHVTVTFKLYLSNMFLLQTTIFLLYVDHANILFYYSH